LPESNSYPAIVCGIMQSIAIASLCSHYLTKFRSNTLRLLQCSIKSVLAEIDSGADVYAISVKDRCVRIWTQTAIKTSAIHFWLPLPHFDGTCASKRACFFGRICEQ
jgi:hypothetical protein